MKVGAEPKKIGILAVLAAAAVYLVYTNVFSAPSGSGAPAQVRGMLPQTDPVSQAQGSPTAPAPNRGTNRRGPSAEFRPPYRRKGGVDTSTIDPKLRLDLLAKVQAVELAPAERNLFQFGAAPVVAVREPARIIPKTPAQIAQEQAAAERNATPPPAPPPPPIALKYYGYTAQRTGGQKRAFFLDGEEIFVAAEGDLVKRRYKIVRIGVNSVVVEDTQLNNTQTLPLAEESAG